MKFKTTKKAIMNGYVNVISVGYCNLQHLLNYKSPVAYTSRREGWGADIYDFGNTAIVTGYSPFGNISAPYDICQKYDHEAFSILRIHNIMVRQDEELDKLIAEFIEEVVNE